MTVMLSSFSSTAGNAATTLDWSGGTGSMLVRGTLAGATVSLQVRTYGMSSTEYMDLSTGTQFTTEGVANYSINPCKLRVNVSGGTTGSTTRTINCELF